MINNTVDLIHINRNNFISRAAYPVTNSKVSEISKVILSKETPPVNVSSLLKFSVKILFFPFIILADFINKLFSKIAAPNGLGCEPEIKNIDAIKRNELLNIGGQQISFGFDKESLLEGMFFKSNSSTENTKTILICSGSHQSYENYTIPMVKAFKSMGHNVMTFNYEGFGRSEGEVSEKGVYRSVEAAYQYLKQEKKCKDEHIIAWGYSLGSGAVTDLALRHKVNIVLDRGFSSMSEIAYQIANRGLKKLVRLIFIAGAHFDNLRKLKEVKGKILIAQGTQDTVMKEEHHGKFLYNVTSKNSNASYMRIDCGHMHNDTDVWFAKGKDRNSVEHFLNQT